MATSHLTADAPDARAAYPACHYVAVDVVLPDGRTLLAQPVSREYATVDEAISAGLGMRERYPDAYVVTSRQY